MTDRDLPDTKNELVELIDRSWGELARLVDSIPPDKLARPGPERWAVKDHLAHLAGWERMTVAAIKGESEEAAVGVDKWVGEWDEERFNHLLYEKWAGKSGEESRAYLEQSHRELMELVGRMDDATIHADMPNEPGRPNADKIAGNTYLHFDEHRGWIEKLLASL